MESAGRLSIASERRRAGLRRLGVRESAWVLAALLECLVLAAGVCWLVRTHTRPGAWMRVCTVAAASSLSSTAFLAVAAARARLVH